MLRFPLKLIPRSAVVRVWQGPVKGKRWIVGSGTHGCWLGSYESAKQRALASSLQPGMVVYDIGANVGFYTLLAATCVGKQGKIHAFEPAPENVAYLQRHCALNGLDQVIIHAHAVSDTKGKLRFSRSENRHTGKLDDRGDLKVTSLTLDDFVSAPGVSAPNAIKIDVEGAEGKVLRGALHVLRTHRPIIFLATHGQEVHHECCQLLAGLGYRLQALEGGSVETTDELICFPGV